MAEQKNQNEHLNVEDALTQSEAFLIKYKNAIIGGVVAVIIIVAGFIMYKNLYAEPREEKAQAALFKGQEYFEQDAFEQALNGDSIGYAGFLKVADDFVFNSPTQLNKYGQRAKDAGKSVGLRVNPECSTQEGHAIYDPCAPGSRLGTTLANFDESLLPLLDGLHFHTLCEQNSDDLKTTAAAFEEKFGKYLHGLKWINFGGGHHITRPDYDIETLVSVIEHFRDTYGVQVYLEPGEAVVYHAGFMVISVLETLHNGMDIAILDTSAACHMPDVLEMPYRPPLKDSGEAGEKAYTYRLGGPTCLAGDIIGDYSFDVPLKEGDKLVFEDMALYTMVKTNTFNGMPLPSIVWRDKDGQGWLVRQFGYSDFLSRL